MSICHRLWLLHSLSPVWKHQELTPESEALILSSGRYRKQLWAQVVQIKLKQEGKLRSQRCHEGVMSNRMTSVLVFPNAGSLVGRHPLTQLRGDGVGVGGRAGNESRRDVGMEIVLQSHTGIAHRCPHWQNYLFL